MHSNFSRTVKLITFDFEDPTFRKIPHQQPPMTGTKSRFLEAGLDGFTYLRHCTASSNGEHCSALVAWIYRGRQHQPQKCLQQHEGSFLRTRELRFHWRGSRWKFVDLTCSVT